MAQAPKQFQVIYRNADRMIVGMSPKGGGVGSQNKLAVIHDMAEYDKLMQFDPAYLANDGATIVGTPPT